MSNCNENTCGCGTNDVKTETTTKQKVFVPRVDIVESDDAWRLVADLPGVEEKDLDITLDKNVLTIRGKVVYSAPEGYSLAYQEYEEGDFERVFTISEEVDRSGIVASLTQGVLHLTLPKVKQAQAQKIPVVTRS